MTNYNGQFLKSAAEAGGFLKSDFKQIAVCGKSNVGKSSFINMLANNSKLARTSNTPGRTRLVNYFDFEKFILTDLPGYGFAKAPKAEIEKWQSLIEDYLLNEKNLIRVLFLVDIRHLPTKDDLQFLNYLYFYKIPFNVIATKADKLSKAEISKNLNGIAASLKIGIDNIIFVSSVKKTNRDKVTHLIDSIL
ncbi:MAG: ribosome biogenesis GTP-binding protein YihA/YsxC [Firmicutes bacterium]|nr:ribosome biogenesis GTP-binding protein YihA/YsxC [Bacillota bacterium]